MINEQILLNFPINFQDKIWIYPPKVKDVAGDPEFYIFLKILTQTQEEIEDFLIENNQNMNNFLPTPLEFILSGCYNDSNYANLVKKAFYFFIKQPVTFIYNEKAILIGDFSDEIMPNNIEDLVFLNEDNFFEFQNEIRTALGWKQVEKPNLKEHPKIKAMKAKQRLRDRIKTKKNDGVSFGTNLVALCCMNFGLNPLNIGEMSYASVSYLTEMYQQKEAYELDISSLLAGADSKKVKPKYWIKNLE